MHQTEHARKVTERFRELIENSGDTLASNHYDELSLLIEAALDSAIVDQLEAMAKKLNEMSDNLLHDAEFFN